MISSAQPSWSDRDHSAQVDTALTASRAGQRLPSRRAALRLVDWIWTVRGSLELSADVSAADAFERLDPLFHEYGTRYERTDDVLSFRKKDQAAQDKMSVFDRGTLTIERGSPGLMLRYKLFSKALLLCFLAPLLFVAMAQVIKGVNAYFAPGTSVAAKLAERKEAAKARAAANKIRHLPMNAIDKALGAPAPDKNRRKKKDEGKKPSTTPAYVFAAIFALLYVIGRVLEDRLIKSLFRKRLTDPQTARC